MAWFRNYYICDGCDSTWTSKWSCTCDDDCPHCGARHISPFDRDDLTAIIKAENGIYVVLRSPPTAESKPDYEILAKFEYRQIAEAFLATIGG